MRIHYHTPDIHSLRTGLILGGLLLIGLIMARLDQAFLDHMPACPFHKITHLPCPLCGSARTVYYTAHGQWIQAAKANPFTLMILCGFIVYTVNSAYGMLTRKNLLISWNGREKKVVFKLLLISWMVWWLISIWQVN